MTALQEALSDPALYKSNGDKIADTRAALARIQAELEQRYARWAELEALVQKD